MGMVKHASLTVAFLSIEPPTYKTPKTKETPMVPPLIPSTTPKGKKDAERAAKEAAERLEKQGDIHVTD